MMPTEPIILVPGLFGSPRLFVEQIPALWQRRPVMTVGRLAQDTISDMAASVLDAAPARFALAAISMGGYVAFEILRRAPERVNKLALLGTSARPDTPDQTTARHEQIALAQAGRYHKIPELAFPKLVHPSRRHEPDLQQVVTAMATDTGPDAFIAQQQATASRPDSRPLLASINCPTLVLVGDTDQLIPPGHSHEIAAGLPGCPTPVTVPGCGHLSPSNAPPKSRTP